VATDRDLARSPEAVDRPHDLAWIPVLGNCEDLASSTPTSPCVQHVEPMGTFTSMSASTSTPLGPAASALDPELLHAPHTWLQVAIWKPKVCTDDTIRYANLSTCEEPSYLSIAMADPQWKEAMNSEFLALIRNKTWQLVPPSSGWNLIDCKWVFKIKRKADESID
jgi:hypothetical protein